MPWSVQLSHVRDGVTLMGMRRRPAARRAQPRDAYVADGKPPPAQPAPAFLAQRGQAAGRAPRVCGERGRHGRARARRARARTGAPLSASVEGLPGVRRGTSCARPMQACTLVQNMLQDRLQPCEDQLIRRARHRVRCEAQAHIEQGQRSNKWTVCLTSAGVIAYLNKRISPLGACPSARVPPHPHLPCYVHGWEPARHRSRGCTLDSAPSSCAGFLAMSARVCLAPCPCWERCSARCCGAARP